MILIVLLAGIVGFALGGVICYGVGRADGEADGFDKGRMVGGRCA